jgi:hypothetical protein
VVARSLSRGQADSVRRQLVHDLGAVADRLRELGAD